MVGEYLGFPGVSAYGGNYKDLIKPLIPSNYTIDTLYDRDATWYKYDIIDIINNATPHIINHDGHSYYGYNLKMSNRDVDLLTNDNPFFLYSHGCMAGGFDDPLGYDCIAEHYTVETPFGAFAAIMNARYGFFWSYSTDGDSTRYVREFWDAVFGEHIYAIGAANQDSKEDNLYLINRSCMRWVYYETNLFGDPSVTFHIGRPPLKPMITGPSEGKIGEEQKYMIVTTDPDGDNVSYFIEFDEDNGYWTDSFPSNKPINITWIWNDSGTHTIRVKARDDNGIESEWSVLTIKMNMNLRTYVIIRMLRIIINNLMDYSI